MSQSAPLDAANPRIAVKRFQYFSSSFRPGTALLVAVSTLLATAPARAELISVEWDAQGSFLRTLQVAPGKFAEVCGKLSQGQTIGWSFVSSDALNFNVHYHEGKKVVYPEKKDEVTQLSGELKVPVDQDYCWMWSNKGRANAPLTLQLKKLG